MEVQSTSDNLIYLVLIGTTGGLLLALSLIFFYIRYQRKFTRQQVEMQKAELEHKQLLLHSIIRSQEEERIRISKDLHDHVGSTLSGLRMMVSRMQLTADAQAIKSIAEDTKNNIDKVIDDVRNISHSLSPAGLELWGFHEALEAYCEKMAQVTGMDISVNDATDEALKRLSFDDALSLFRVMQELVNNTIKHAGAKHVHIEISRAEGNIEIRYADDGIGLKSNKDGRGIGLYNIESRLDMMRARYAVTSAQGGGYAMTITLPETVLNAVANG